MMEKLEQQRIWIRALQNQTGMSSTELARKAALAPSTLNKPMNDLNWERPLSPKSIKAIADAVGLKPLEMPNGSKARLGEAEVETVPFVLDDYINAIDNTPRAVIEMCKGRNGRKPWVVKSNALNLQGIIPGDILITDLNVVPNTGDIVCAEIYSDWNINKAETVFRLFHPPYLLMHSTINAPGKPDMIDNDRVSVRGTVINIVRKLRQ